MIRSTIQFCMFVSLLLSLIGCKKEEPNPELLDPIFKDLQVRYDGYTKNLEESKKKIEELTGRLEKAEPRTIEVKNLQKELAVEKLKLMNAEQLSRYYKIRSERRKLTGRLEYKKAFAKDLPWPDPKEFEEYQTNIRLQNANRNWATRVPKLQDRTPANLAKAEKGTSKSAEGEKKAEEGAKEH